MVGDNVRLKSYVDAINAEQRRTVNAQMAAVGVAIVSQMIAAFIFSRSTSILFNLHNDLIRSGERKYAETKAEMATDQQVKAIEERVSKVEVALGTSGGRTSGAGHVTSQYGVIVAFLIMAALSLGGIIVDLIG